MHLNIQYFFLINFCLNVDEFARPYGNFSHDHATSSNGRFQRQVSTIMTRKKNQLHTPQHNWGDLKISNLDLIALIHFQWFSHYLGSHNAIGKVLVEYNINVDCK
jgi:hypothetical protein